MTEQRVSDEEVRRTAEAAEVMFSAGHYDPLVTRTKTVYDCSLMALDLLDARARVRELHVALNNLMAWEIVMERPDHIEVRVWKKDVEIALRALRGEEAGE